jgi:hypothetical protein
LISVGSEVQILPGPPTVVSLQLPVVGKQVSEPTGFGLLSDDWDLRTAACQGV